MAEQKEYKIVFVVAHPDDEAIWIGNLLHEVSKFEMMKCYVICLSGNDPSSSRKEEFFQAMKTAGYENGVVLGGALRKANDPLPSISQTVEQGLKELGLDKGDISVLITHSPYGDEQGHPHHIQAYKELFSWTGKNDIPFGYFSCLPVSFAWHQSLLHRPHKKDDFYILNFSRCMPSQSKFHRMVDPLFWKRWKCPSFYIQFYSASRVKEKMLECYESIGVEEHKKNYATALNPTEALYLFNRKALEPFNHLMELTDTTTPHFFKKMGFFSRIPVLFEKVWNTTK